MNKKTYIIEYNGSIINGEITNNNGYLDHSDECIQSILFFLKDKIDYFHIYSSKLLLKRIDGSFHDNEKYYKDFIINIAPMNIFKYGDFEFKYIEEHSFNSNKCCLYKKLIITTYSENLSNLKVFIKKCNEEYLKFMNNQTKLMLVIPNIDHEEVYYTTYDFISNKTFSNLLFNKKDKIISMLNALDNKKIDKLGILMYGKPGSGKTTMIKCIANYTKRSIVTIDFKKIKSRTILLDILFRTYVGRLYLPLSKRIYVIEDIDCASKVVLERSSIIPTNSDKEDESLTLSDILNCIDGILELKNTIMIFTTNYIDKLDKALIRPGRIDLKIELSYMDRESKFTYIKNAYPNCCDLTIHNNRLDIEVTPAELENLVLLNQDNYENFLIELEKFRNRTEL
jgi:energy-coupling factor transporter ATP-binding protein EcfA2